VLVVLGRYVPRMAIFTVLFGDEATLAPAVRFYQRVLANDDAAAVQLARSILRHGSALELAEDVLLPAISMEKLHRTRGTLSQEKSDRFWSVVEDHVAELEQTLGDSSKARGDVEGRTQEVLCVPVQDDSEELDARIAAVALTSAGAPARTIPRGERGAGSERSRPVPAAGLVCSAAPHAYREVRETCQEVRRHFPDTRLLVGLWGKRARERGDAYTRHIGADAISSSLSEALAQMKAPETESTETAEAEPIALG